MMSTFLSPQWCCIQVLIYGIWINHEAYFFSKGSFDIVLYVLTRYLNFVVVVAST